MDVEISIEEQSQFNKFVQQAKEFCGDGKYRDAVDSYKKAYRIASIEKLKRRIEKIEKYLEENGSGSEEEDEDMIELGDGFQLHHELANKLYLHQRQGVLWLYKLHTKKKGGILADDMGLGKTIQTIAFLSGLFDAGETHHVLIVMPVSVMGTWTKEFNKWAPGCRVLEYHGTSKKERERALYKVQVRGGVLLTTYGMVVSSHQLLSENTSKQQCVWDYVILDEGHKIKNPTKTSKSCHAIPAEHRIILTGTAIQNNLRELWALFDFVQQGTLLGTSRTFKMAYENPITRAREKDATSNERRLGQEMAESLKDIIAPFFLRRTKADVAQSESNTASGDCPVLKMPKLTRKNDLIVWVYLSDIQQSIYRDFIQLDDIKELLMTNRSPLVALTVLKKICDHPRLLPVHACMQLGLDFGQQSEEVNSAVMGECAASRLQYVDVDQLIAESGKLQFLSRLLSNLRDEGHRTLFFSQSRRMLDVVQKMARKMHHKVLRMDGTVRLISERNELIDKFQTDSSYTLFLLTTQVGGEGLTLTAADRVVIFDPSWNPARDSQAVDRVFRIGQNRNVVVYRLITCGTVEEKIYRRQVFKDSITRQTTGKDANPMRYFTKQELRELFVLDDSTVSQTQQQLAEIHAEKRHTDTQLDQHIAYLHSLPMYGISDHDLMFSEQDVESDSENTVESGDYVQARVREAQKLINSESSVQSEMNRKHGGFVKPPSPLKPKKPTQQLPRPLHLPPQPPHVPTQLFTRQDEFSMAEAIGHVSIHDSDEEQAAVEAEEVVVITDACTSINQTPDTSAHDVRRPGVGSRQISTEINGNMSAEADSSTSDEEVVMIDANTSCQQANHQLQTPEVSSPFTNGPSASSTPAVRRHTHPTDVVREASTIAETDRTGATSVLSTPAVRRHTDPSDVAREASTAAETDRSGTAEIIEETDSVPTLSFVSSFLQDVSPAQHAEKQTPGDTAQHAVLTNQTGSTPLSCRRLSSHRAAAKRRSSARLSHPVSPYVTRQEELIISPLPKRPLIQLQESPQVVNRSRTSFYTATESLNDDDDVVCASPVLTEKSIFHRTRRFVEDSDGDESPVRKPEQTFVAATPDSTDEISPIATDLRRPSDSIGSSGTDRLVIEDSLVESEVEELSRSRCEVEDMSRSEELSRSRRRRSTALQPIILDESDSDQSHDSASDGSEDDGCEEETDGEICTDGGESDSEVDAETEDQGSYSDLPPLQQLKYSRLLKQARQLERSGDVSQSLKHVLAALEICSEPETQAFALRLHKQLKQ